jgi:hypothetical protein
MKSEATRTMSGSAPHAAPMAFTIWTQVDTSSEVMWKA